MCFSVCVCVRMCAYVCDRQIHTYGMYVCMYACMDVCVYATTAMIRLHPYDCWIVSGLQAAGSQQKQNPRRDRPRPEMLPVPLSVSVGHCQVREEWSQRAGAKESGPEAPCEFFVEGFHSRSLPTNARPREFVEAKDSTAPLHLGGLSCAQHVLVCQMLLVGSRKGEDPQASCKGNSHRDRGWPERGSLA